MIVVYRATKQLQSSHGTQPVNKHIVWTNRTTRQRSSVVIDDGFCAVVEVVE